MSTALIWIFLPLFVSILMLAFRKHQRLIAILGSGLCLFLAILPLVVVVDTPIKIGSIQFTFYGDLPILGRVFTLSRTEMSQLTLIYGLAAYWFGSSLVNKTKPIYVPLGLALIAILVASMAVKPFIYSALFIEIAVFCCIPLMADVNNDLGKGAIRFLIFQTLGLPFILLAGWFLAGGEITPISGTQLIQSSLLLGLGFSFWLGIFPLYTWIPMVAKEANAQISGFIFSILPIPVLILIMDFLNSYAWLRDYPIIYPAFRWLGVLMVVTGGIWSLFQTSIKKLFGYVVLVSNGLALMALGARGSAGIQILAYSFVPRLLGVALISFALAVILKNIDNLGIQELNGVLWKAPVASLAFVIGIFTVSGMPLFAGFPFIEGLASEISIHSSIVLLIGLFAGIFLLFFTGLRIFALFAQKKELNLTVLETRLERVILSLLIALNLLIGLFPAPIFNVFANLVAKFSFLFQ